MFVLNRAFRLFFLGAISFSIIAMTIWWWQWQHASILAFSFSGLTPVQWHAHEMIFGYALATVTGFLLTAVMNWSRMNSASGKPLALLFSLWVIARLGFIFDWPLVLVAISDLAFTLGLLLMFSWPVWRKRLTQQIGLCLLFLAIFLANLAFYAAVFTGWWSVQSATLAALFLVLSVNLTMIRRLTPFFTEKALGLAPFTNSVRLDQVAMVGFLVLLATVLYAPGTWLITLIAWPLTVIFMIRQAWWYDKGIWSQLLLWPLHLSYAFITVGIALYGFVGLGLVVASAAIHALAAGGIGLLCSSMVARISLGHTNRNVFDPPRGLIWVFVALTFGAVVRVALPVAWPAHTLVWIELSQISWVVGFGLLLMLYWKILTQRNLHNHSTMPN